MVAEGKQRFMALFVFFPLPRSLRWKRKEPLSVILRAGTLTLPHDLDSPLQTVIPIRVRCRTVASLKRHERLTRLGEVPGADHATAPKGSF